jgi:TetR/AcrR family transcriptional regulator, cholesterol catabolism regulator
VGRCRRPSLCERMKKIMEQVTDFKSQDKSLRRQMIIETATNVFHQKGYRTATLDDVAHELGLTKAALYYYFSSKEDLLSLIYIQALENYFASAYEIDEMDLAPPEKLRFLIRHHIKNIIIGNLPMFAVFFSEENQLPQEQFHKIKEAKLKYSKIVEKIIIEGIAQGFFRPLDPKLQANAMIGMCNWIYKWYKPDHEERSSERITDQFLDLLENGYMISCQNKNALKPSEANRKIARKPDKRRRIMKELREKSKRVSSLLSELEKYF